MVDMTMVLIDQKSFCCVFIYLCIHCDNCEIKFDPNVFLTGLEIFTLVQSETVGCSFDLFFLVRDYIMFRLRHLRIDPFTHSGFGCE